MNRRPSAAPHASSASDVIRFRLDVQVGMVRLTIGGSDGILTRIQVRMMEREKEIETKKETQRDWDFFFLLFINPTITFFLFDLDEI